MGPPEVERAARVRTVLGDVDVAALGPTNYHEHLFQVSPLLVGEELDDEDASRAEAASLRGSGFAAMVDATPTGLGHRPAAVARISRAAGLHVVATTGAHREPHYGAGHWLLEQSEEQLAVRFTADVEEGLPVQDGPGWVGPGPVGPGPVDAAIGPTGEPVRAGVVKAGIGYWSITASSTECWPPLPRPGIAAGPR